MSTATNSTSVASSASKATSSSPRDGEASKRVIAHMNRDHPDSLTRYLEAHIPLSPFAARNAQLSSLTTSSMIITSGGFLGRTTSTVPISPPMKSLDESRERLVQMDKDASKKLGKSPQTVKRYEGPKGLVVVWVFLVSCAWILNSRAENGRWVGEQLGNRDVGDFLQWAQPKVLWFMIVAHLGEAALMARKCTRHTVATGSMLWCKWVGTVLLEGFTAFGRFDSIVKAEKERQEKAKH